MTRSSGSTPRLRCAFLIERIALVLAVGFGDQGQLDILSEIATGQRPILATEHY
jgi:hypothetical protein